MSLDNVSRDEMVRKYLDRSHQTWTEAEAAKKLCMWPMTANRMYYSLVNALRALLLTDQHPAHTHAGMKSAIGQFYVLSGELTIEESKVFSQMETLREKSDYDCYFDVTEDRVEALFVPTKMLIDKLRLIISRRTEATMR